MIFVKKDNHSNSQGYEYERYLIPTGQSGCNWIISINYMLAILAIKDIQCQK